MPFYFDNQASVKSDISFSNEQRRAGNSSLKFSLTSLNRKPAPNNYVTKSEVSMYRSDTDTTEVWYGFSLFMPGSSMKNDAYPILFMQWHANYQGYPGGFSYRIPIIFMTIQPNNTIQVIYGSASEAPTAWSQLSSNRSTAKTVGKVVFDEWVDYVVHIRFAPTTNKGILQMWQNGTQLLNDRNMPLGYKNGKPYWKFGLNCFTGSASHTDKALYVDQLRYGNQDACYDAVAPSGTDGLFKPMK